MKFHPAFSRFTDARKKVTVIATASARLNRCISIVQQRLIISLTVALMSGEKHSERWKLGLSDTVNFEKNKQGLKQSSEL